VSTSASRLFAGASAPRVFAGWAHPKGFGWISYELSVLPLPDWCINPCTDCNFLNHTEAPVKQIPLRLLERIEAPSVVPSELLALAKTYREACRMAWQLRRVKGMNKADLGRDYGLNRQHCTDYLTEDDAPTRRSLPAESLGVFELAVGNTFVTQWLSNRAGLTVLEQMQADQNARRAA
jgi:hypothetical protein